MAAWHWLWIMKSFSPVQHQSWLFTSHDSAASHFGMWILEELRCAHRPWDWLSWPQPGAKNTKACSFNPHMDHLLQSWTWWSLCVPSNSEYSMNLWIDQILGSTGSTKPLLLELLMQAQHIRISTLDGLKMLRSCALAYPSLKQDLIWTLFEYISIHILPLFLNISSWKHIKMAIYGKWLSAGWHLPA